MKFLGNVFKSLLIGAWLIIAIFVTVCLLSYNQFNVTTIGKNTLLIIDNDELEPDYKNGDLVLVKRESDKKINIGDMVFFYNGNSTTEYLINIGKVTEKQTVTNTETTYKFGDRAISGEYIIGQADKAVVVHNWGTVLKIIESRWGYLFLVILPTLFALVYETFRIIEEAKKSRRAA